MSLCPKCKTNPKASNGYCVPCNKAYKDARRTTPKKFNRRVSINDGICPRCRSKPKSDKRGYCDECHNAATREWASRKGGYWKAIGDEGRKRAVARKYLHNKLVRGHIKRGPCAFCGNPSTQFHHYDYEPKTMNYDDVCDSCHGEIHRFLKTMKNIYLLTMGLKVK